ncbi:MAG: alpha/beta fold hydrolase [Cyclobacteriaceae bacterium]
MKLGRRILKYVLISLVAIVLGVFIFLTTVSPGTTSPFEDKEGNRIENSIAEMAYVPLGISQQFVLIRGVDKDNPVLLLVHGGPGMPDMAMYRKYNGELEKHFTVAYWHQRGAGKSTTHTKENFTIDRFVEDAQEITLYLKEKFEKEKIFLLGHSWGSLLGITTVHRYPNDYLAYIGVGQIGNVAKSENLAYEFTLRKVRENESSETIALLEKVGGFANRSLDIDLIKARAFVSKYGALYKENSLIDIFGSSLLYCEELTISEKLKFISDNSKIESMMNSPNFSLLEHVFKTDLTQTILQLEVPVYVLQGEHDYLTNYTVAREYFELLEAPKKEFVTFQRSGHFPAFEEPEKFNDLMINRVLRESME